MKEGDDDDDDDVYFISTKHLKQNGIGQVAEWFKGLPLNHNRIVTPGFDPYSRQQIFCQEIKNVKIIYKKSQVQSRNNATMMSNSTTHLYATKVCANNELVLLYIVNTKNET